MAKTMPRPRRLSVRKTDAALGMREDLLAIELALAHDLAATTPASHTLGASTTSALRPVQKAIDAAGPAPASRTNSVAVCCFADCSTGFFFAATSGSVAVIAAPS